jgi:chemotaxis protein CheD
VWRRERTLAERTTSITENVEQLEDQFLLFNTLVTKFHNVDIANRIEVAKQHTLRQMGTSSEQMTQLTVQIEKDVDDSLQSTRGIDTWEISNDRLKSIIERFAVLHPGEFTATREAIILSTVLESCIAVALYDPAERIGGRNHFMVPGELRSKDFYREKSGRYGMHAMELLIHAILKERGVQARKVLFSPDTARVLLKRFGGQTVKPLERVEGSYLSRIRNRRRTRENDVTFFSE